MIRTTVSLLNHKLLRWRNGIIVRSWPWGRRFVSGWSTIDFPPKVNFQKDSLGPYVIIVIIGTSVCDKNHGLAH